ncbi:protein MFI [Eucyclogobius newberryi]|uniref:protein MFI n=1 Tax=Eucyclogobius newberryi TaxID=166745 RepID=UPI003B5BBC95
MMATAEEQHQTAAVVIQKAWRSYLFRAIFGHYKELIGLCHHGDPQMILKTVNPREGELLDAAAGVFIRFRLGGTTFPPSIFYKIFTYRPIADLCASSPRIYAKLPNRQSEPANETEAAQAGRYQRSENNNWRLYRNMLVPKSESAECDDEKKVDFRYTKLQRRQDLVRWRKKKKIEWLKQMYSRGRLEAASLVDNSKQEVVNRLEKNSEDIMDWELNELLAWSDTINFEEYMTQWRCLACSQPSERSIGPFHYVGLATEIKPSD